MGVLADRLKKRIVKHFARVFLLNIGLVFLNARFYSYYVGTYLPENPSTLESICESKESGLGFFRLMVARLVVGVWVAIRFVWSEAVYWGTGQAIYHPHEALYRYGTPFTAVPRVLDSLNHFTFGLTQNSSSVVQWLEHNASPVWEKEITWDGNCGNDSYLHVWDMWIFSFFLMLTLGALMFRSMKETIRVLALVSATCGLVWLLIQPILPVYLEQLSISTVPAPYNSTCTVPHGNPERVAFFGVAAARVMNDTLIGQSTPAEWYWSGSTLTNFMKQCSGSVAGMNYILELDYWWNAFDPFFWAGDTSGLLHGDLTQLPAGLLVVLLFPISLIARTFIILASAVEGLSAFATGFQRTEMLFFIMWLTLTPAVQMLGFVLRFFLLLFSSPCIFVAHRARRYPLLLIPISMWTTLVAAVVDSVPIAIKVITFSIGALTPLALIPQGSLGLPLALGLIVVLLYRSVFEMCLRPSYPNFGRLGRASCMQYLVFALVGATESCGSGAIIAWIMGLQSDGEAIVGMMEADLLEIPHLDGDFQDWESYADMFLSQTVGLNDLAMEEEEDIDELLQNAPSSDRLQGFRRLYRIHCMKSRAKLRIDACVVCMGPEPTIRLIPCGHRCFCDRCYSYAFYPHIHRGSMDEANRDGSEAAQPFWDALDALRRHSITVLMTLWPFFLWIAIGIPPSVRQLMQPIRNGTSPGPGDNSFEEAAASIIQGEDTPRCPLCREEIAATQLEGPASAAIALHRGSGFDGDMEAYADATEEEMERLLDSYDKQPKLLLRLSTPGFSSVVNALRLRRRRRSKSTGVEEEEEEVHEDI